MKYSILILWAAVLSNGHVHAQYPENLRNGPLRDWLKSNLYDGQASISGYDTAREQMFSFTDEVNGKVNCVYTDFEQNSEFTTFLNPINTEHIVPQSFYGSASPMRNDIHNLRPTHGSVNSARSNKPLGEIPDSQADWYGVDGTGDYVTYSNAPSNTDHFSESVANLFEPQEDRKGEIARQIFYFYTMYPTQAGSISNVANINTLYTWHLNDPVDAEETTRNNRIAQVQGNRNPYIDYPELVYDAWFWVEILGCTDPNANNYSPSANSDDGSCTYNILGCTDVTATNYNPSANMDDGSCEYAIESSFNELEYEIIGVSNYGITVRVFALFSNPNQQLITVYGDSSSPLSITSQGVFYQDGEGGPTSLDIDEEDFSEFPSLPYDSWVTIGSESSPNNLNLLGANFGSFEQGQGLIINDLFGGGWYVFPGSEPSAFPDENGRVLMAQLTATDDILLTIPFQSLDESSNSFLETGTLSIPIDFDPQVCNHPLSYNFNSTSLLDKPCEEYCLGDFNGDREIDINDFLIFQPAFTTTCE